MWSVPREWAGETAFVIAGGPSVSSVDLGRLRGRRVVVVNTSYVVYPNADYLVFTDLRWWRKHQSMVRDTFNGRIVTVVPPRSAIHGDDVLLLNRHHGSGIGPTPTALAWWHTTLTSVNDFLRWLGVTCIAYLGLDGQDQDGKSWHHESHPEMWGRNPKRYHYHGLALQAQVEPLRAAGIQVFNLNPNSAHRMFPFSTLDKIL